MSNINIKILKDNLAKIPETIHYALDDIATIEKEMAVQKSKWIQAIANHVAPSTVIKITEEVDK